jgi:uracil-DNA glycosylase family 4
MQQTLDPDAARAALEWQIELGADEAIGEAPVNRYALEPPSPASAPEAPVAAPAVPEPSPATLQPTPEPGVDAVEAAGAAARTAQDLAGLEAAMATYEFCELKRGARNLVFADGNPAARVMIIGEAPGRDEDSNGKPFVGRAGQLLDRMLAAIDMGRTHPDAARSVYITNILPWRPPQNRDPTAEEIAMMMPFVARHVDLAGPDVILPMGNISCQALLGRRGITRLRGQWTEALGRPALPMFHPAYLLRNPHAKREAWHDLLVLQGWLREAGA